MSPAPMNYAPTKAETMIPHIEDHYYPPWRVCNRTPLELGEGPRMLPDGRVVAVDILRGQLWQIDLASPEATVLLEVLPLPLGAVAPIAGWDTALLAAAGDGIAILDGGTLTWLVKPEPGTLSPGNLLTPAVRMNDAVCDPQGRFWTGTMALDASPGAGALHRVNRDGSITTVLTGLTIPNGPAFIADGSAMYLADSAAGTITRFAVEPGDGTLGTAQPFATVSGGSPDGMVVDTEDHLWVAIWGAGRIHRYRPDGSLERIVHVPAQQPTSICFAGDTMSTLVVTTASIGLSSPGDFDGLILSADVGISGLPTPSARINILPEGAPPAARNSFLFSYFAGDGTEHGEQVHFAVSDAGSPLVYTPLNAGRPVLTSTLGEAGVRDPFLLRSELTGHFHLLSTDLRIYADGDWDRAERRGSRSIAIWDSSDLVNWEGPRLVSLPGADAGNAWAPEAFFDRASQQYVVFWASALFPGDPAHAGPSHHRIMYVGTTDFKTFTDPGIYLDKGYSVIDTTMIEHDGLVFRFSKDERTRDIAGTAGKYIFQESGRHVFDEEFTLISSGIGEGHIEHGEGPIVIKDPYKDCWHLFVDEFGKRGYTAFTSTDLRTGAWTPAVGSRLPPGARHGSILPITEGERLGLLAAYGSGTFSGGSPLSGCSPHSPARP